MTPRIDVVGLFCHIGGSGKTLNFFTPGQGNGNLIIMSQESDDTQSCDSG